MKTAQRHRRKKHRLPQKAMCRAGGGAFANVENIQLFPYVTYSYSIIVT
jgi:hypothetical protein